MPSLLYRNKTLVVAVKNYTKADIKLYVAVQFFLISLLCNKHFIQDFSWMIKFEVVIFLSIKKENLKSFYRTLFDYFLELRNYFAARNHFKKYLMAIESYFWILSKKSFLDTNLWDKKSRQSNAVVI